MKVYIVGIQWHEGQDILGVYSTREKALEALPYLDMDPDENDITEYELDLPPTGEIYETYYYYSIKPNGEFYNHGTDRRHPSEAKEFNVSDTHNGVIFQGFGKTEEEARLNCEKLRNPPI